MPEEENKVAGDDHVMQYMFDNKSGSPFAKQTSNASTVNHSIHTNSDTIINLKVDTSPT